MQRATALAVLTALAACSADEPAPGPNVLLVTVDSLRADRLGCYGYTRDTSPRLDALAEEGVRFERAYAHAPFTPPSHASLLTGLNVPSHGVLGWTQAIPERARTLGERLGAAGWRTGAFYNHPGLRTSRVFRGFDEVQERCFEEADRTVDSFLGWLDGDDGAWCAWLHLWDVHRPYGFRDWREDWARELVDREELTLAFAEDRFGEPTDRHIGRGEGYYNLTPADRARPRPVGRGESERRVLAEADYRYLEDRYDGGVAYADRALGRLLDALAERGELDTTLVVITADHGESLREREACWFTHDPFLFEETLRVPLILRLPGGAQAGAVIDGLAGGVDVLPTILAVCGVALRGDEQGRSLLARIEGRSADREATSLPLLALTQTTSAKETDARVVPGEGWLEERVALVDERWKLVYDRSADRWSLYDLSSDPGEVRDVADDPEHAPVLAARRELLERLEAALPRPAQVDVGASDEVLKILSGTGYLGE